MKIQLKRSNVLNGDVAKAPTAGQMEYGELAVNYNSTDPAVFIKDSDNTIVRVTGSTYWDADGENLYPTTSNGDVLIGGTLPASPTITLENSGDGTFTGTVTASSFIGDGSQLTGAGSLPPASDTAPSNPEINDFWVDSSACPPEIKIYTDCAGDAVWESLTGTGSLAPPAINVVALGNTAGGPRFTLQDFDVTVAMAQEGIPVSQKGVKGILDAYFQNYPSTDVVNTRTESFPNSASNSGFREIGSQNGMESAIGVEGYYNSSGVLGFIAHTRNSQGSGMRVFLSDDGNTWNQINIGASVNAQMPMFNVDNKYISAGLAYCSTDSPTEWVSNSTMGRFTFDGTNYIGTWKTGGNDPLTIRHGKTLELMISATDTQVQLGSGFTSTENMFITHGNGVVMTVARGAHPNYTTACYVSFDSGVTFQARTTASPNEPQDLMYFNGTFYMIAAGIIWKTSNNGSSWTQSLAPNGGQFYRVQNDGKYVYTVYTSTVAPNNYGGNANECGFMRSINNGASWDKLNTTDPGGQGQNNQNAYLAYRPEVRDLAMEGGTYVEFGNYSYNDQNGSHMKPRITSGQYGSQTLALASNLNLGGDDGINVGDTVRSTTSSLNLIVKSIDGSIPSMTLSGAPDVPVGGKVVSLSPIGAGSQQTKYLQISSSGQVTNLLEDDPGYVSTGPDTAITLKFPAEFDGTGNAPDVDMPVGASIQVEVQANNSEGGSTAQSNILTPTPDLAAAAAFVAAQVAAAAAVVANGGITVYGSPPAHPPIETPVAIDGFYPLYQTEEAAAYAGNGHTHTHLVNTVTYYMPDAGVDIYHGDYPD